MCACPGVGARRIPGCLTQAAGKLGAAGFEIVVERGAGVLAGFPDGLYADAGAALSDHTHLAEGLDALVRVSPPNAAEVEALPRGAVLIGFLQPLSDADGIARLEARGIVGFAMESIPRITRARIDGRVVFSGDDRRVQGRAARRGSEPQALPAP